MGQNYPARSHRNANANGFARGAVLLGFRISLQIIIESSFMQEDCRVLANLCKSFGGTAIATVREFEAGREGEGDSLRTVTMRDPTADQIRETSSGANRGFTTQTESVDDSSQGRGRRTKDTTSNLHPRLCRAVEPNIGTVPLKNRRVDVISRIDRV